MPIRRRDTRDRLTFELVESSDEGVDDGDDAWPPVVASSSPSRIPGALPDAGRSADPVRPPGRGVGALTRGSGAWSHDAKDGRLAPDDVHDGTPDDDPVPGDASGLHPPPGGGGAGRNRRRRTVVVSVSAGVVLVLGGMLAVDAWHARGDLDRLRDAAGGIEPILGPPRELWSVDADLTAGFTLVPGGIVTVEEGDAVVRDLASGEVRWRAAVGEDAACGAPALWTLPSGEPEETLVCLAPRYDDRTEGLLADTTILIDRATGKRIDAVGWDLTVLGADGEVLGRRDLATDGGRPSVGPDATVLRVDRVGEPPVGDGEPVEQDPATGEIVGLPTGRDVVVTAEDALTGEARWRHELGFVPGGSGSCLTWGGEDGEEMRADLENVWAFTGHGMVQVEGCGVSAWFDASGTRLDVPENPNDGIVRLADGSLYRDPESGGAGWGSTADPDATFLPAVLDERGAVRWKPPGPLYVPQATDGSAPDLLLGRDGIELVAWDPAGTERWRTSEVGAPSGVAVVAGGVVVVPGTSATLEGLDATTGRHLWTIEAEELAPLLSDESAVYPVSWEQFFTDGERAVMTLSDWETGTSSLVAVDLADGAVAWHEEPTTDMGGSWAVPLRGALFRVQEGSLARVG